MEMILVQKLCYEKQFSNNLKYFIKLFYMAIQFTVNNGLKYKLHFQKLKQIVQNDKQFQDFIK